MCSFESVTKKAAYIFNNSKKLKNHHVGRDELFDLRANEFNFASESSLVPTERQTFVNKI